MVVKHNSNGGYNEPLSSNENTTIMGGMVVQWVTLLTHRFMLPGLFSQVTFCVVFCTLSGVCVGFLWVPWFLPNMPLCVLAMLTCPSF